MVANQFSSVSSCKNRPTLVINWIPRGFIGDSMTVFIGKFLGYNRDIPPRIWETCGTVFSPNLWQF